MVHKPGREDLDSESVEVTAPVAQVRRDGSKVKAQARFRYEVSDPYTVRVVFGTELDLVQWSFARDLLVDGLDRPAGLADVRVWPWTKPGGEFVALALSSDEGSSLFQIPRCVLERFLRRTRAVVPSGREAEHIDVDGVIARLLAGC